MTRVTEVKSLDPHTVGVNTPEADRLCARMGRIQCGLFSDAQGRAAGLSEEAIRRRISRGRLTRVLPGVLGFAGVPDSWDRDLTAVSLWAGDGSAASHRAAARKLGFHGFTNSPAEISTTNRKNCTQLQLESGRRIVVHRVDEHLLAEITFADDGMPLTSARKTILDLAGRRHPRAEGALDAALRRGLTDIGQLWLLLEQEWMRGRRGVAIVRDLLIPRTRGRAPTDSDMELDLRRLIDNARLPAPVHQYPYLIPSGSIRMDLAYPDKLLGIEADSYSWHWDREAFERDRRRDNELRALGWTVLRFTWTMIQFDPDNVSALIRQHLYSSSSVQKPAL